ncbi:MAG: hypothetical protein GY854_10585 [Deltaproteobacteria bacterium]|nr:hypothetical protein [Deltaproteobacteria bacterium]
MTEDSIKRARIDAGKYEQASYILWLFREQHASNWRELCDHFGANPHGMDSLGLYLYQVVASLHDAGLLELPKGGDFRPWRRDAESPIKVSESASRFLGALQISLAELATNHPRESMRVSPIFGRPFGDKYAHDLFVLMPFADELNPIYNDHIRKVANALKLSIARADDFFTQESIIQEIWCAIAQSTILIADCTGRNPNVFYEIGMAHSIGKRVILITQNPGDIPFDLRHRRYIHYTYTPPGMKEFEKTLKETVQATKADIDATNIT